MKQTDPHTFRGNVPWRLVLATVTLALAGAMLQPAFAQHPDGPGMRAEHGGRHHLQHLLDAVGATDAQRAQIRQIMDSAQSDLKPVRGALHQLRAQGQALFAQPAVDANAAEGLRQQELVLHNQRTKRMLQARLDMSAVLTPEQRRLMADRMADRMAERRAKMADRRQPGGTPR